MSQNFLNKYFRLATCLLSLFQTYYGDDSKAISIYPSNLWRRTKCFTYWVETCRYLTWAISNSNRMERDVIRPTNQELVKSEYAAEPRPLTLRMVWVGRNAVMKTDWQNKFTLNSSPKHLKNKQQRCLLSQLELRFELKTVCIFTS